MLRKLLFIFWATGILLSACGTLEVAVDQASPSGPTPEALTPTAAVPAFAGLRFNTEKNSSGAEAAFPSCTRQIFATWEYANMRAGLTVRREWYRDGTLWLRREEPWDFAKYGANGTL